MPGSARVVYLTGVRLKAHGRTWNELFTNVWEQLTVEFRTADGSVTTLTRSWRSRRRWLLHRDQVLLGTVRRRWDRTWDGFSADGHRLITRAATRHAAVDALLLHAG